MVSILSQPDDSTCGPTCLHAVYLALGDSHSLEDVVAQTRRLPGGGVLLAMLGEHALGLGFEASIVTINLKVFDPSWFEGSPDAAARRAKLSTKLAEQAAFKADPRLSLAADAYRVFLEAGGEVAYREIGPEFLQSLLEDGPVIAGLNATYLHGWPRERDGVPDDIGGEPIGHFVVLSDLRADGTVAVSDPFGERDATTPKYYRVPLLRLAFALALGVLTYDANLLVVRRRANPRS